MTNKKNEIAKINKYKIIFNKKKFYNIIITFDLFIN